MAGWQHFIVFVVILCILASRCVVTVLTATVELNPTNSHHSPTQAQITLHKLTGEAVELGCPVRRRDRIEDNLNWKLNNTLIDQHHLEQRLVLRSRSLRIEVLTPKDAGFYACEVCSDRNICEALITQLIVTTPANSSLKSAKPTTNAQLATSTESDIATQVLLLHDNFINQTELIINTTQNLQTDANVTDLTQDAIESAPKFTKADKMPPTIRKPAGNVVHLMCPFIGNPMPNITWTRNDTEIIRQIGTVRFKKFSMTMEDLIANDSGIYKCTVCNRLGCIEHATKLDVSDRLRSPPIHSDRFPMNQTVLNNTNAIFECRVVSDLEPLIVWVRYTHGNSFNSSIRDLEKTVPTLKSNFTQYNEHNLVRLTGDLDRPQILRLNNVTHKDEGWYTCIAANSLGQSLASAYLRVVDKLPTREVYSLLRNHPIWITVVIIVVLLLFSFGGIFIIYVLRKLKHEKLLKHQIETVQQWTKRVVIYKAPSCDGLSCDLQMPVIKIERKITTRTTPNNQDSSQAFNEYEFPLDANWEIPRNQLKLGDTLGEGAFGRVVMAEAFGLGACARLPNTRSVAGNEALIVAVKMVKDEHTDADMASLVREMEVMKLIGKHINIINLLACCSQNGPLWVIVEYAPHGNLKDFLKQNRPMFNAGSLSMQRHSGYCSVGNTSSNTNTTNTTTTEAGLQLTEKNLISFAFQIARGMEYLASRKQLSNKILIKQKHLIEAFNTTRPSLNAGDVARYKKTYARFTNKEKGSSSREYVAKRATLA